MFIPPKSGVGGRLKYVFGSQRHKGIRIMSQMDSSVKNASVLDCARLGVSIRILSKRCHIWTYMSEVHLALFRKLQLPFGSHFPHSNEQSILTYR
jgi:hypothetical protein